MENVKFNYTNHRGVTRFRVVMPIKIWFGSTEWHTEPQWFLNAVDVEKHEVRDFAFAHILTQIRRAD